MELPIEQPTKFEPSFYVVRFYCDADVQSSKSGVPRVGCDCQCGPGASVANGAPACAHATASATES
jgi:hypothetical protein